MVNISVDCSVPCLVQFVGLHIQVRLEQGGATVGQLVLEARLGVIEFTQRLCWKNIYMYIADDFFLQFRCGHRLG